MEAVTIYRTATGEVARLPSLVATAKVRSGGWSHEAPAPEFWELEQPRYRLSIALKPPMRDRMRHDPPWSSFFEPLDTTDQDRTETWQYADRLHRRGETITSTAWPHTSMQPLNYSARRVMEFFNAATKSRLPQSPWLGNRVRLDDGMSFNPVQISRGRDDKRA